MSFQYLHPGVYTPSLAPPLGIEQSESAVVAFIGLTEKARGRGKENLRLQAVMIRSLDEYEQFFGTAPVVPVQLQVTEVAKGVRVDFHKPPETVPTRLLYYAVAHFFANGGGPCYVISAGSYRSTMTTRQLHSALQSLTAQHPATVLLCPDICNAHQQQVSLTQMLLSHCAGNKNRFCILDVPAALPGKRDTASKIDSYVRDIPSHPHDNLSFGALYYPYLHSDILLNMADEQVTIDRHISPAPGGGTIAPGTSIAEREVAVRYPHVLSAVQRFIPQQCRAILPPSGALAAVYQRSDAARGVWTAPANIELAATHSPALVVDGQMNQQLNNSLTMGIAVNPVRQFPRRGTRVWGARTLHGSDPEWRYVNVRRLACMIHRSVNQAFSDWAKDSNTQPGWIKARAMVDDFLTRLWRQGALAGVTANQAHFINVGYGLTMSQDDIDSGRMVLQLGFAPIRPAEFVVLAFTFRLK